MKTFGIILLIIAALNLIIAIVAIENGASEAANGKFLSALLIGLIGGALFYAGNKKREKKNNEIKNMD